MSEVRRQMSDFIACEVKQKTVPNGIRDGWAFHRNNHFLIRYKNRPSLEVFMSIINSGVGNKNQYDDCDCREVILHGSFHFFSSCKDEELFVAKYYIIP